MIGLANQGFACEKIADAFNLETEYVVGLLRGRTLRALVVRDEREADTVTVAGRLSTDLSTRKRNLST